MSTSSKSRFAPAGVGQAAETLWRYHCLYHPLVSCQAIIGLGSYDLRVAERCAQLFLDGYAPRLVFTGAFGHWTRDRFARTEAATFAEHAIACGVPAEAILLEEDATNLGENVRFAARLLDRCDRVILVTKPQTQRRCHATARKQWPAIAAMVTAPLHAFRQQPIEGHGFADLVNEMVGDIYRIRTYPEAGFQIPQEIPDDVAAAYDFLIARGFTKHIPVG